MSEGSTHIDEFPIVAIGASAGGIESMTEFLEHVPPDTGCAFVFIQHLDPTYESKLTEILSKHTRMKVLEAKQDLKLEPDQVVVVPAARDISLSDSRFILSNREPRPALHMPIDQFFISLAKNHGKRAIGIILSGSANDGTAGLKEIKAAGGITFAQDFTAKFQGMPKSAIAEEVVDFVLSPQQIAGEVAELKNRSRYLLLSTSDKGNDIQNNDQYLEKIIQLLRKNMGVDFTFYKMNTIKRRIVRRMMLHKLATLKDYVDFIELNPPELNILYHDLLIKVTYFFRDMETLEYVKKNILPQILKNKSPDKPVRIWVAACSTGEEAYSLAMILTELIGEMIFENNIQIFATDLSEVAIARARMGIYSLNDVRDISPKRLQKFFTKIDGSYRVNRAIRDLCIFAPHNIFRDPPFSKIDLISCCNLMIYLETALQNKILSTFHYALKPEGHLILGKSESVTSANHLFLQLDKKHKVFVRKNGGTAATLFELNVRTPAIEQTKTYNFSNRKTEDNNNAPEMEKLLDGILLNHYAPPCVLVNYDLDILISRGSTAQFLELPAGRASLNLLKMAKSGLAFELRSAINKSARSGLKIKKDNVEITNSGKQSYVGIEVTPVKTSTDEKLFLVIFLEDTTGGSALMKKSLSRDELVQQLQEELAAAREDMRLVVEEQESNLAELQSANEEIVSSNEELQSINEELETSKEEVESSNEELMTINTELQLRNEQLAESYEYSEVVYSTMREAVLVLDSTFQIMSVNEAFYRIFNMTVESTVGQVLFDLQNGNWDLKELRDLFDVQLRRQNPIYGFELKHNFPGVGEKFLIMNVIRVTQKIHHKQIILLAIEDITEHKKGERIIAEREAWFRNMADYAPAMILVADEKQQMTFFNKSFLEFTGLTLADSLKGEWKAKIHEGDLHFVEKFLNEIFITRNAGEVDFRLKRQDGQYRWIKCFGKPTFSTEDQFTGFVGTCQEVHDQRMLNEMLENLVKERTHELKQINRDLEYSNDELKQFAYVASHDLQEPLRKIITYADRLMSLKESLPEEGRIFINRINDSTQRMTKLIDDVLNFSSISNSNQKYVRIDLRSIIREVLHDFDLQINQKHARVNFEDLPIIEAVPGQMKQLFHNLISNALKFTDSTIKPEINITSTTATREELESLFKFHPTGKYYHLVVRDNGIGFDQEFAEKIFVIFQRLNDKHSYPGTGIGLALCKKIVDTHGGHIYAYSKENEGATFHIILPEKHNIH